MSSTPLMKKNVCQNCKVACKSEYPKGNSNNFLCPRCRFMDSVPIIKSSNEEACSICLVDFNSSKAVINELPCRHQFHRECIYEWIGRSKYSCPLCRYKLPIDDTIMRPTDNDGLIPARYELSNGERIYLPPPDHRTMVMFYTRDGRCYYAPRSWTIQPPQVVTTNNTNGGGRRTRTIQRPHEVVTTNNTNGGRRTTTTTTATVHNSTTILQDEYGDSVMLDNTILQDEDGDTLMIDA